MSASGAQAGAEKSFGDLPLIVLTAKLNNNLGWPEWQSVLLQLSSNSQHMIAENSGHLVQLDEPRVAVEAIVQVIEQVRTPVTDGGVPATPKAMPVRLRIALRMWAA